jgi:cytochrome b561
LLRNSENAWGWPAILLHWLAAAFILALLGHGWWMTHVVPRPERIVNYSWHAAIGYDLLVVLVLRLLWRWWASAPALPKDTRRWERIAAYGGHVLLYVFTFATAFVGWALAGTMRTPLTKDLFDFVVPGIYVNQDRGVHGRLEDTHRFLAYVLAAIVVIHIAGALRHQFIKHNDVLRRMLWPLRAPK